MPIFFANNTLSYLLHSAPELIQDKPNIHTSVAEMDFNWHAVLDIETVYKISSVFILSCIFLN